jgi:hypothetical protein
LIDAGRRQQIARELLDGELVERLVGVEGVDDVVAIRPRGPEIVRVFAVRVAVADGIEPVTRAVLAVPRALQQPINDPVVGIG